MGSGRTGRHGRSALRKALWASLCIGSVGACPQAARVPPCPTNSRPMNSLSQIALGAAVGIATMGRRTAVQCQPQGQPPATPDRRFDVKARHGGLERKREQGQPNRRVGLGAV